MMLKHFSMWADKRLADAVDLIEAVVQDHSTADDKLPEIYGLIHEVSKADDFLAGVLRDRAST
ncbi:hypothetical protein L7H23_01080 [Sphingopyxis sp. BSN-002]|uniref:hypothetical protein n=1 Tax=Sphingopyxis sp. BSN-002 TaxID=2911495 RepID=UPI001EDC85CE|nr:hypothetical protein [Sphingopyxis sp. BSN-002]QVJ07669.1 hypothetical protein [Sphingopyxis phage VSN-002]UKK84726.1 hypothetical protein L7H23_01080 [Sphingopyxis sp. BSN-002]